MAHLDPSPILERFAAAAREPGATPSDVALWTAVTTASGRLGAARVRDSARRSWSVEPHRDARRGRFVISECTLVAPGDDAPRRNCFSAFLILGTSPAASRPSAEG